MPDPIAEEDVRDLTDPDQEEENKNLYGMGRGLFGNEQGEKDIEQSLGNYHIKKTRGLMTKPPPTGEGPMIDIAAKIKPRARADDAPGAIIPYKRRDEAILDIINHWGEKIYEAPIEVLFLCSSLLEDIDDEKRFSAIREYFESQGIKNMPTWESAKAVRKRSLDEIYSGFLGIGGGTRLATPYPWDRPGAFSPGSQKRADKGFTFHVPKPPSRARRIAGKQNAYKIGGTSGGMQSRMARARKVLDTIKKRGRRAAGEKNSKRMQGSRGRDFRHAGGSRNPMMRLAAGKYTDIAKGKVILKEGDPTLEGGMPWFHGTVERKHVGGVPSVFVEEGHIICSGSLPRPTFTEGYKVWDCQCPLGSLDMQVAFAQIAEGMESVRPWLKKNDKVTVLGIPTEGLIVRSSPGNNKDDERQLEFLTFDSASGNDYLQEWMVIRYAETDARQAVEEAITYGYVRAGAADLILDRVLRKLNRLNILDVFEDALFDTNSEALYVLLYPNLEETEVQEIAMGLQQEYPEVQILGGPLDEDLDWWVLYLPKPGSDFGPDLDSIFEPNIARPLDVAPPDIIGQAIQQVAKI